MISRKCSFPAWQRWKVFCFLVDTAKVNRAGQADTEWCHQLCVEQWALNSYLCSHGLIRHCQLVSKHRLFSSLWHRNAQILWVSAERHLCPCSCWGSSVSPDPAEIPVVPVAMELALTAPAAVLSREMQLDHELKVFNPHSCKLQKAAMEDVNPADDPNNQGEDEFEEAEQEREENLPDENEKHKETGQKQGHPGMEEHLVVGKGKRGTSRAPSGG